MLYEGARVVFRAWLRVQYRWRVEGVRNIPPTGPVVLASNHVSLLDPIVLGSAANRKVYFMAKEELFRIPVLGQLIRLVGAFPVRRGESDRTAIRRALEVLNQGQVLGVFVEGTRNRQEELLPAKHGAFMLAYRGGAPVVPVAICHRTQGRPLTVRFGEPVWPETPAAGVARHEQYEEMGRRVTEHIQALLEPRTPPYPAAQRSMQPGPR